MQALPKPVFQTVYEVYLTAYNKYAAYTILLNRENRGIFSLHGRSSAWKCVSLSQLLSAGGGCGEPEYVHNQKMCKLYNPSPFGELGSSLLLYPIDITESRSAFLIRNQPRHLTGPNRPFAQAGSNYRFKRKVLSEPTQFPSSNSFIFFTIRSVSFVNIFMAFASLEASPSPLITAFL